MNDCIFCAITAKTIPAKIVHEDEDTLAFHDIDPKAPTHVVVIPRQHLSSIAQVTNEHTELWNALLRTVQAVVKEERLDGGYRVVTNVGSDGGQSVDHLHLHILGGRALAWPPG